MDHRKDEWLAAIAAADDSRLRELDGELFGKSGDLTALVKGVAQLPKEERRDAGRAANQLKAEIQAAYDARRQELADAALAAELAAPDFDPTEPGPKHSRGTLHPITVVRDELVDLFTSMGFTWQDGPEVESDFFNFEALNIPADHPARDSQDTFWLDDGNLLRTHTSPVQIRTMQRMKPPLKVIVPGRCFRQETVDATHEHTFYQMEGLVVDKGVSTANLLHTMKTCLREILRRDLVVRCRPGFFPFVEPGFELDVKTERGWMEILPCGMVHPRVLQAGGIDPEEYTGFAFGMGLTRVVMLRYGIDDIRTLSGGDLRFLRQFEEVGR